MSNSLENLSPATRRVFAHLVRRQRMSGGVAPTYREIADGIGLRSFSTVGYHIKLLEEAGLVERAKRGKARSVRVIGSQWRFDEVGDIAQMCEETQPQGEVVAE